MGPLLLLALGGAVATGLFQKLRHPVAKTPSELIAKTVLSQPPSAPGQLTPARVAVHGDLMTRCIDPNNLRIGAALFNHEQLPAHAQALLSKAALIHEMMHGAADIVQRSRAGDQHAMAMAKSIGDQARQGNKRAQLSWFLIEDYTKRNPPSETPIIPATLPPEGPINE
jgi:hypothetical protein